MWRIVAYILLLTFVVLVVSQMLLPVFSKTLQPFWLFRRKITDQSAEQSIEQASVCSGAKPKCAAKDAEVKSEKSEIDITNCK